MRIGIGYDVHKLVENRELILGGVTIPYEKGLLGHSDADVLVHSIIDSILGACKKGDIGKLFPDTDNSFKNISSIQLLKRVNSIIKEDGYEVLNIDSIIVAQRPRMLDYIFQMEQNIADALNISVDLISVKATTEENLGFTGSGEGISAKAVCLLKNFLNRE